MRGRALAMSVGGGGACISDPPSFSRDWGREGPGFPSLALSRVTVFLLCTMGSCGQSGLHGGRRGAGGSKWNFSGTLMPEEHRGAASVTFRLVKNAK